MAPSTEYPPGTTVNDRYELLGKLGRDGQVYEAHDRNLNKRVALKILTPVSGSAQSWDEAHRLEQLRNRYIVPVINADVIGTSDLRFIATDLLVGGDLESAAAGIGLSLRRAASYMRQIAAGVDRIHASDMVHRDIKPANVLLREDDVVVSDLEFCQILDSSGKTEPNGSYCTVAPEALGHVGYCSKSSDIYSLGATAFYLLSGEYPVDHRAPKVAQKSRILQGEVRDLATLAPHVPRGTISVVRRALNPDPGKRHASAEDFGNSLAQSIRNARDWGRIVHKNHQHCWHAEIQKPRGPIDLCTTSDGGELTISATHSTTGRRVRGVADTRTTVQGLPQEVRRLIADLR